MSPVSTWGAGWRFLHPGGFYSDQLLENIIGCQVRNTGTIHPEWAAREGAELSLHPKAPAFAHRVGGAGRALALVAYMATVRGMSADGRPGEPSHPHAPAREEDRWMAASWLFLIESAGQACCRSSSATGATLPVTS